jgi:hypothetical protein
MVAAAGFELVTFWEKVNRDVGMSFRVNFLMGYCIDSLASMWHISDTFFG